MDDDEFVVLDPAEYVALVRATERRGLDGRLRSRRSCSRINVRNGRHVENVKRSRNVEQAEHARPPPLRAARAAG